MYIFCANFARGIQALANGTLSFVSDTRQPLMLHTVACWVLFLGGAVGYQSIVHRYNVTLGERWPKDRGERHRCEVVLGGGGGVRRKFRVSEMPFPGL